MIGVFDSGHGGLTTLAALQRDLPEQTFLYLGDHANAPYGSRTPGEITALTRAALQSLFDRGCTLVIIACNTAAAVALRDLQQGWLAREYPRHRALGVFVPVIEALSGRGWADDSPPDDGAGQRIAIFATQATVDSGAFPREMAYRARNVDIRQVACPGLVEALEAGQTGQARALARDFAGRLEGFVPDKVFLGCTHYPLVADAFAAGLPPGTPILSQPDCVAASLRDYLKRHPRHGDLPGDPSRQTAYPTIAYLTTGDPAQVRSAAHALTGHDFDFRSL
ncbi:glutamate racemase [Pontivivens nitratireducens]|uniref:glutamate racemase n=1 Tax=Pontivivens nitratireducens TaxID=2758038 RepID=UPI00163B11DB|nr:aspartate/glutamate racemase family protein [Pontibrevibacter nitratireducens]